METREYRFVNKESWTDGPWQNEPDKVQWPDAATGLPCLAVRNSVMGVWCGYVGVAEGHPYFGIDYQDEPASSCEVHGGLTYSGFCRGSDKHGICHVAGPGEPGRVWWLGFDCGHCWDLSPGMDRRLVASDATYRDLAYVRDQCANLARQLGLR